MIKISVDVTAVRLIVDEVATLKLKMGTNNYVDFPIYDESFPLVKAGKKFRLTLEEAAENEVDDTPNFTVPEELENIHYTIPDDVREMHRNVVKSLSFGKSARENGPISELMPMSDEEVTEFTKTRSDYPEEFAQECQGSFDEVSNGIPMGVLRFAANEVKKTTLAWADKDEDKVDERTKRFKCPVCVHKPYSETCALCKEGSMFKPSKGPFCDGCKHIGVNPESGPCAVCFEGMMYESDKEVLPLEKDDIVVTPDEEFKVPEYLIHQRVEIPAERILHKDEIPMKSKKCLLCVNIGNVSVCDTCNKFDKFKDKIFPPVTRYMGNGR